MCGIFGVWGAEEAANLTYLGLHGLQHRGQESAGIVASNGERLTTYKRMGKVADVFSQDDLKGLSGSSAIGHVRYSTTGSSVLKNAQPFAVAFNGTSLAIAHNGNITNAGVLRTQLEREGALFHTSMDTEVIVHLLARSRAPRLTDRLREVMVVLEGAYSLVILTPDRLVAVRDPHGFRPLVIGERDGAYLVASETCALRLVEGTYVREVEPGEIVSFDSSGIHAEFGVPEGRVDRRHCIFEYIYFARPDSKLFGQHVYDVRKSIGARLSEEAPVANADVVIPVPDSGIAGAIGYAKASGIAYELGLIRSHYAGRTFIEPSASIRHFGVKLKLSPVESAIRDRVVVVVDDSIVRGTTSKKIVRMLREAGAREVHMRITAPPTTHSCFYGIDTPNRDELIAANYSIDEITEYLEADSLAYLSLEGLLEGVNGKGQRYCDACFTGAYPVPVREETPGPVRLAEFE
jgi:amidophosphoribosyltransferase